MLTVAVSATALRAQYASVFDVSHMGQLRFACSAARTAQRAGASARLTSAAVPLLQHLG